MVFDKKKWAKQDYLKNKDRLKNCPKKQAYLKSINRKKSSTLNAWKRTPKTGGFGLITEDYEYVWKRYIDSKNCEKCNIEYGEFHNSIGSWKTMHHNHKSNVDNFVNILCHKCNVQIDANNIYYEKKRNRYRYQRTDNGVRHRKSFKTKYKAIIYKWLYEAGYSVQT